MIRLAAAFALTAVAAIAVSCSVAFPVDSYAVGGHAGAGGAGGTGGAGGAGR